MYCTIRMPHLAQKLHRRRREGVVFWETQLGGEYAALKGRALGPLDECFPVKKVVFGYRTGGDALGRVVGEGAVFLQEAAVGC